MNDTAMINFERRARRLKRLWWDVRDDLGEFVSTFILFAVAVGALALCWWLFADFLQMIKHHV